MTIYVLSGFNNYYNRIVKKFNTVEEYEPYEIHTQQNYNFVPNDSVDTQIVLGSNVNNYNGEGDYLLVVNEFDEIVSRWFIIESVRDRAGQYTLTLHRDLVADHYDQIIDKPMYIEKATLSDSDTFIWNGEGVSTNKIKTKEYLIKDRTRCAWIVGYFDRDYTGGEIKLEYSFPSYNTVLSADQSIYDYIESLEKLIITDKYIFFDYANISRGFAGAVTTYYHRATLSLKTQTWQITTLTGNDITDQSKNFTWSNIGDKTDAEQVKLQKEFLDGLRNATMLSQLDGYIPTDIFESYGQISTKANYDSSKEKSGDIITNNNINEFYKIEAVEEVINRNIEITTDLYNIDQYGSIRSYLLNNMKSFSTF